MVTAYYISKLSKSKKIEIEEYYQDLLENFVYLKTGDSVKSSRCRVCLKPCSASIFDTANYADILEALKTFGDVTIDQNDDLPKGLCAKCDMFIKTAILFKKKVKQTEAALKQYNYFKTDTNEDSSHCQDFIENSDENDDKIEADIWPTAESVTINFELKVEKQEEKVKLSPKVTCRICGKIVNRSYYREHLTMHDPNPHQWVCEICGKSFRFVEINSNPYVYALCVKLLSYSSDSCHALKSHDSCQYDRSYILPSANCLPSDVLCMSCPFPYTTYFYNV